MEIIVSENLNFNGLPLPNEIIKLILDKTDYQTCLSLLTICRIFNDQIKLTDLYRRTMIHAEALKIVDIINGEKFCDKHFKKNNYTIGIIDDKYVVDGYIYNFKHELIGHHNQRFLSNGHSSLYNFCLVPKTNEHNQRCLEFTNIITGNFSCEIFCDCDEYVRIIRNHIIVAKGLYKKIYNMKGEQIGKINSTDLIGPPTIDGNHFIVIWVRDGRYMSTIYCANRWTKIFEVESRIRAFEYPYVVSSLFYELTIDIHNIKTKEIRTFNASEPMHNCALRDGILYARTVYDKLYVIDVHILKILKEVILKEVSINHYPEIHLGKNLLLLESATDVFIHNIS